MMSELHQPYREILAMPFTVAFEAMAGYAANNEPKR